MKTILLASLALMSLSTASFAAEICGTLDNYSVGPNCAPGTPCPDWVRLQYAIVTRGVRYNVAAGSMDLMSQLSENNGKEACLRGEVVQGQFDVSAVIVN